MLLSRPRLAGEMWSAGETMGTVVRRNLGRVACDAKVQWGKSCPARLNLSNALGGHDKIAPVF